ncbi:hypothetical protein OPV22_012071 [Ensete ventricosum]|uniref:Uncharacterized protein n=1 Tax=Ensete ventricosum TaxID=4639 RepID=A0AAV8QW89_ENSVE|nr:hypothetical protein OPV22_012071 [Ensete ventricosum]
MKITLAKRREIATVLRKDVAAMPIPRPMVAGGTVVLAEFFAFTGNASTAACRILEMLPPDSDLGSGYSTIVSCGRGGCQLVNTNANICCRIHTKQRLLADC